MEGSVICGDLLGGGFGGDLDGLQEGAELLGGELLQHGVAAGPRCGVGVYDGDQLIFHGRRWCQAPMRPWEVRSSMRALTRWARSAIATVAVLNVVRVAMPVGAAQPVLREPTTLLVPTL